MKYFKKYFIIWWIPIVFYIVPLLIFLLGMNFKNSSVVQYSGILFLINLLGNIISSIVQIVMKKWYYIFPQILASIFLIILVSILFIGMDIDFYGADHPIPENIKCEEPPLVKGKNTGSGYFVATPTKEVAWNGFEVENARRTGNYYYSINFQPKEKGYLFIKAYEIGTNERLSEELANYECTKIEDLKQNFYSGNFTIYEGVGSKYCARIELWFKPNNGKEYKINQKNYIVEGKD